MHKRKRILRRHRNEWGYKPSEPTIVLNVEENDVDTFTKIVRKTFHINPDALTDEEKERDDNIVKNILNKSGWRELHTDKSADPNINNGNSWGMGATKSSYTSNQSPEPSHAIKLSSLMNKPGVLSKKFRKACAKLGVELIVTTMHFETLDNVTGVVKRLPTLDTFNEIIDIIED